MLSLSLPPSLSTVRQRPMSSFTYGWPSFLLTVCLKKMKQWAFTMVYFMLCPWRQTPCQGWPLLPRKTVQRSVEIFKRGQCSRISVQADKTRTFIFLLFFELECLFGSFILHLTCNMFLFPASKIWELCITVSARGWKPCSLCHYSVWGE